MSAVEGADTTAAIRARLSNRERIEQAMPAGIDAVMAVVDQALFRARNTTSSGRCRSCGAKDVMPGGHHNMDCRSYRGPLTHTMRYDRLNPTFGGSDYRCDCGGYFRQGGLAGHDTEPVCPFADQEQREGTP